MGKGISFFQNFLTEDESILVLVNCNKETESSVNIPTHLKNILTPRFCVAFTTKGFHIASKTFETLNYEGTLYYNDINFFRYSLEDNSFTIIHSNYSTSKFLNAEVKTIAMMTNLKDTFEYVEKTQEA